MSWCCLGCNSCGLHSSGKSVKDSFIAPLGWVTESSLHFALKFCPFFSWNKWKIISQSSASTKIFMQIFTIIWRNKSKSKYGQQKEIHHRKSGISYYGKVFQGPLLNTKPLCFLFFFLNIWGRKSLVWLKVVHSWVAAIKGSEFSNCIFGAILIII